MFNGQLEIVPDAVKPKTKTEKVSLLCQAAQA
jgi:hypothetical protein